MEPLPPTYCIRHGGGQVHIADSEFHRPFRVDVRYAPVTYDKITPESARTHFLGSPPTPFSGVNALHRLKIELASLPYNIIGSVRRGYPANTICPSGFRHKSRTHVSSNTVGTKKRTVKLGIPVPKFSDPATMVSPPDMGGASTRIVDLGLGRYRARVGSAML